MHRSIPAYAYVVRGNMNRAVYFSMTIEEGAQDGHLAKTTGGVINDTEIDVDADGHFTVHLGRRAARAQLAAADRERVPGDDPPLLRARRSRPPWIPRYSRPCTSSAPATPRPRLPPVTRA